MNMDPFRLLFYFLFVIPSAIFHEYAHAFVADKLGDPTARYAGRLTLNPLVHIDPFGTLLLPFFLAIASGGGLVFAYAKPVPFNPYNLRYPVWGPAFVGLAGPLSNILLAVVFGLMLRFFDLGALSTVIGMIVFVNLMLAVFNLVPIPPLDGSKVLFALLPRHLSHIQDTLEKFGWILLLMFVLSGASFIFPLVQLLFTLITNF